MLQFTNKVIIFATRIISMTIKFQRLRLLQRICVRFHSFARESCHSYFYWLKYISSSSFLDFYVKQTQLESENSMRKIQYVFVMSQYSCQNCHFWRTYDMKYQYYLFLHFWNCLCLFIFLLSLLFLSLSLSLCGFSWSLIFSSLTDITKSNEPIKTPEKTNCQKHLHVSGYCFISNTVL